MGDNIRTNMTFSFRSVLRKFVVQFSHFYCLVNTYGFICFFCKIKQLQKQDKILMSLSRIAWTKLLSKPIKFWDTIVQNIILPIYEDDKYIKQAGAELCQAQVKLCQPTGPYLAASSNKAIRFSWQAQCGYLSYLGKIGGKLAEK